MNYIKTILTSVFISMSTLFVCLLFITLLNYYDLINYTTMNIITLIIPIISLILGGLYIGKKAKKRGFLEGIKLGLLFCLLLLIFNLITNNIINIKDFLFYLIIISSSIFGSMIGINTKKS